MDKIVVRGGRKLKGTIPVRGAKNAALPIMAATLLTADAVTLGNIPALADIASMRALLAELGTTVATNAAGELVLKTAQFADTVAPYDIVRKMRASILVLGPLLARAGRARVSLPGGCAIGTRPVDLHLKGLAALGADINLCDGYIEASVPKGGLRGAAFHFPLVSVTATENVLMAATLARGQTILTNAAREPEVTDLAQCLVAMGARIEGIGTDRLVIEGCRDLQGAAYSVIPDRIEAGTFMCAAAITGGAITLTGANWDHMTSSIDMLAQAGVRCEQRADSICVTAPERLYPIEDLVTMPYPGFATDLQAQMMAALTLAKGTSRVSETIFENRFMHVPELMRMGADISVQGGLAIIAGVDRLKGAPVMATDLRASSSLILAGLAAEGETTVNRIYHLDRGYEKIEQRLSALGADIARVREDDAALRYDSEEAGAAVA